MLAKLDRFDCLILDDLGYVRKDQAETTVLFELIAERYERKPLDHHLQSALQRMGPDFPDPAMTVAAIDRLVHHATILELNTESYRRRALPARSAKAEQADCRRLAPNCRRPAILRQYGDMPWEEPNAVQLRVALPGSSRRSGAA